MEKSVPLGLPATVADEVHELLAAFLPAAPDELGNMQAVFRLDVDDGMLAALVPETADPVAVVNAAAPATALHTQRQQTQAAASLNYSSLQTKVSQAVDALESAATNWSTLTPAQKDQVLKLVVQVTSRLARLEIQRLDASP
jgi:hypothetical protein